MNSLYPARRIPQAMIVIGSAFMALALAMTVGHFVFGVPIYNRNTGQPSSDFAVAILAFAFGGIGGFLVLAGRTVLRAFSRHHRKRAIDVNGS
jgi:cytochrome bd-type quinol oxidase subunit 2